MSIKSIASKIFDTPLIILDEKKAHPLKKIIAGLAVGIFSLFSLGVYANYTCRFFEKRKISRKMQRLNISPLTDEQKRDLASEKKIHVEEQNVKNALKTNDVEKFKRALENLDSKQVESIYLEGLSLLFYAVENNNQQILQLLLQKGVEIDKLGRVGTPLEAAARKGLLDIVKMLLEKGANINGSLDHQSPLWWAMGGGEITVENENPKLQYEVIEFLLSQKNLDINKGHPSLLALVAIHCKNDPKAQELFQSLRDKGAGLRKLDMGVFKRFPEALNFIQSKDIIWEFDKEAL